MTNEQSVGMKDKLNNLSDVDLRFLIRGALCELYKRLIKNNGFGNTIKIIGKMHKGEWPDIIIVDESSLNFRGDIKECKVHKL